MKSHAGILFLGAIISLAFGMVLRGAEGISFAYEHNIERQLMANLLAITEEAGNKQKALLEEPFSILFAGDVMLDRGVAGKVGVAGGDWRYPFVNIGETLKEADVTVANLEGPISARGENQGSKYSFRFMPEVVSGLKFAGFDVLTLANNHIWDYGAEALKDTRIFLEGAGILGVGAGRDEVEANKPAILNRNGTKVAFWSYTNLYPEGLVAAGASPGISDFDLQKVREEISRVKQAGEVDVAVVLLHWGEEYKTKASEYQKETARKLVAAGADLVVGTHPHVAQEVERIEEGGRVGFAAYSLGNFVFDQDWSEETQKGLVLKAVVRNKQVESIEELPVVINGNYQPEIVQALDTPTLK